MDSELPLHVSRLTDWAHHHRRRCLGGIGYAIAADSKSGVCKAQGAPYPVMEKTQHMVMAQKAKQRFWKARHLRMANALLICIRFADTMVRSR